MPGPTSAAVQNLDRLQAAPGIDLSAASLPPVPEASSRRAQAAQFQAQLDRLDGELIDRLSATAYARGVASGMSSREAQELVAATLNADPDVRRQLAGLEIAPSYGPGANTLLRLPQSADLSPRDQSILGEVTARYNAHVLQHGFASRLEPDADGSIRPVVYRIEQGVRGPLIRRADEADLARLDEIKEAFTDQINFELQENPRYAGASFVTCRGLRGSGCFGFTALRPAETLPPPPLPEVLSPADPERSAPPLPTLLPAGEREPGPDVLNQRLLQAPGSAAPLSGPQRRGERPASDSAAAGTSHTHGSRTDPALPRGVLADLVVFVANIVEGAPLTPDERRSLLSLQREAQDLENHTSEEQGAITPGRLRNFARAVLDAGALLRSNEAAAVRYSALDYVDSPRPFRRMLSDLERYASRLLE